VFAGVKRVAGFTPSRLEENMYNAKLGLLLRYSPSPWWLTGIVTILINDLN
jgi:hypothetical protein